MWARASEGDARGLSGTEAGLAALRARAETVGACRVSLLPARSAAQIVEARRAVEARALAHDPCLHPEFLAAAARHDPAFRDLALLVVWRDEELCGIFPFLPGGGLFSRRVARAPRIDPASSGAPFLVRDRAEEATEAAIAWFLDRGADLVFEDMGADAPFRNVLARAAARRAASARFVVAEPGRPGPADPGEAVANPTGAVFERAGDPAALRAAVENLLLLESREAEKAGRAALIARAGAANLVRAVTRQLARAERCRVFSLRDAAGPLAVAIALSDGERSTLWRIASDPERGGERARALLASRMAKALERGKAGALAGMGSGAPARVSCRVEPQAADRPATIARRLGERLRHAATLFSRAA